MSRQLIFLMLVAASAPSAIASAQETTGVAASEWIQTEEFGLQAPAGWTRHDDSTSILTIVLPTPLPGHEFRDNVRVMKYPLQGTNDLYALLAAQTKSVEDGLKLRGSGVIPSEPRIAWLATSQKQAEPGRTPLAKVDYMMIHGQNMFVLHAMCEESFLETSRPVFEAIARSVKFVGAAPSNAAAPAATNFSLPTQAGADAPPPRSSAYQQGKKVGYFTALAMFAAIAAFGGFYAIKALVKR